MNYKFPVWACWGTQYEVGLLLGQGKTGYTHLDLPSRFKSDPHWIKKRKKMPKYRTKSKIIEVVQFTGENIPGIEICQNRVYNVLDR